MNSCRFRPVTYSTALLRPTFPTLPLHNAYGHSKLYGERALLAADPSSCVLQLPLLYGPCIDWNESAVTSLTPAIVRSSASTESGSAIAPMDAWATRYPTYTPDVAVVIRGGFVSLDTCAVRYTSSAKLAEWLSGNPYSPKPSICLHTRAANSC